MILELDLNSDTPIYLQIKEKIIEGIALKQLVPGEGLPSVRALASDLGVNMHTVNKAYQLLKQDGYLLIHRQKGVVIQPEGMPSVDNDYLEKLKNRLQPLISESVCRGMTSEQFMRICHDILGQFEEKGE
ncbi:GntR family transcriptional regulator [Pullulanibacillus pueri]|uniref:GntR family transcriptional regulator n=1 Tax=Pullulanibacillus pueri TaxID=1437324 RepID=UPI001664EEEA|nr:GntR family transcriptional regulator [Pullulanibacillus pueri]